MSLDLNTEAYRQAPSLYRKNVGIILLNEDDDVLVCRRIGTDIWQFPQGGVQDDDELLEGTLFRELYEEVGLPANKVRVLARTKKWRSYPFPNALKIKNYIGQRQHWFLLRCLQKQPTINLSATNEPPEFDQFSWVSYYHPILLARRSPKHQVYREALIELSSFLDSP